MSSKSSPGVTSATPGVDALHAGFALAIEGCSQGRGPLAARRWRYPMRKVTTPVPVEGGVAGGAPP
jgi:hypothetical protein